MGAPSTLTALLHGPDQPGLVARVAGWIFARGGNILHADQHRDMEAGVFFQRIEWVPCVAPPRAGATSSTDGVQREADDFGAFTASLAMQSRVTISTHRPRVAVLV